MTVTRLMLVGVMLLTISGCGDGRASADEWCTRKAVEAAGPRVAAYNPSVSEMASGHDTFMRACMRNQGY